MKDIFMYRMTPEELEFILRKVVKEEMQRQHPAKKDENVSSLKDEILDIQKASEFLQLPVGTIRKKIKCSKHPIPYMKPSRSLLFRKSRLVQWQKEEEQIKEEELERNNKMQEELDAYLKKRRKK